MHAEPVDGEENVKESLDTDMGHTNKGYSLR